MCPSILYFVSILPTGGSCVRIPMGPQHGGFPPILVFLYSIPMSCSLNLRIRDNMTLSALRTAGIPFSWAHQHQDEGLTLLLGPSASGWRVDPSPGTIIIRMKGWPISWDYHHQDERLTLLLGPSASGWRIDPSPGPINTQERKKTPFHDNSQQWRLCTVQSLFFSSKINYFGHCF